jgi:hypothetical protein
LTVQELVLDWDSGLEHLLALAGVFTTGDAIGIMAGLHTTTIRLSRTVEKLLTETANTETLPVTVVMLTTEALPGTLHPTRPATCMRRRRGTLAPTPSSTPERLITPAASMEGVMAAAMEGMGDKGH